MKKSILWGALFSVISTLGYAESSQPNTTQNNDNNRAIQQTNPANTVSPNQPAQRVPQNNTVNPIDQSSNQVNPQNIQANQNSQQTASQQQASNVINCEYKLPAETQKIDDSIVLAWSEKATIQSFDFNADAIDTQMNKLQSCFTSEGWIGFNSALQKSGNLEAIKSQKLKVISQIDGLSKIVEAKDNQWKVSLPVQVVYQNDKEKVTQLLIVNISIARKASGELGIYQMVATPRVATQAPQASPANTIHSSIDSNTALEKQDTHKNLASTSVDIREDAGTSPDTNEIIEPSSSSAESTPDNGNANNNHQ